MAQAAIDLSASADEANDIADQTLIEEADSATPKEKAKARRRMREKFRKLHAKQLQIKDDVGNKRDELLQTVLVKNGYEFDREFWYEEADTEDINDIIIALFKAAASGK
jgi:rRNA-processing protein FCF1